MGQANSRERTKVTELVLTKIEDGAALNEMAESANSHRTRRALKPSSETCEFTDSITVFETDGYPFWIRA
jgi:hypothetical protein